MAKRRLSRQQQTRIRELQKSRREEARSAQLAELDSPLQLGTVISHFGQQLEVEGLGDLQGGNRWRCYARANLGSLVTGDQVSFRAAPNGEGVIEALEPRQSLLSRPDKFGKLKPVAANIDQIVVVIAVEPEPFANLIDRYLVAAELSDIPPLLVMNKSDLLQAEHAPLIGLMTRYEALGYPVIRASVTARAGLDELRSRLQHKTSVLVGQSGVGKSSLIQALLPEEELRIGDLSTARSKGTHTTTSARLYHLPEGGKLVDSPGIREFGLWHIDEAALLRGFREFPEVAAECRFRDCKHFQDPGCALAKAVKNGKIRQERAESYQLIRDSLGQYDVHND